MKQIFYLSIITTILLFNSIKTSAQRVDYEFDSGLNIGFGIGASYQCSDIRNSIGEGFDFTFGSAIYQKENAFFSIDWRYRFLYGQNIAFDDRINIDSTYNNVKYTHFNNDIEFIITLNRLRNSTGIILSGFFGAGLAYNISRFDLYDGYYSFSNSPYDYSVINPDGNDSREQIYHDLQALSDDDFETKGINHFCLTPTAGIYLGYQFTKHFSIGIEHKTNFFLKESNYIDGANIDGVILSDSRIDNNNYTALIFRWDIGRGNVSTVNSTHIPHVSDYTTVENVVQTNPCDPPVVNINSKEINSSFYTHEIYGSILNIQNKESINITIDGRFDNNFTYDPISKKINSKYILAPGIHSIVVTAENECGKDSKSTTINIGTANPPCYSPIVNISVKDINTNYATHEILGTITNIENKSNISITVDGQPDYKFIFDPNTKNINSSYNLTPGLHSIVVSAFNECGKDSKTYTIEIKENVPPCYPPVINISINSINSNLASHELTGNILNVLKKNDISITVDGKPDYKFTVDPYSKQITSYYQLSPGIHTIIVNATNECGSDSKTFTVKVDQVAPPCYSPVINLLVNESSENNISHKLAGTITNIKNKNDITVKVDGSTYLNFSFNATNGQFSSMFNFNPGLHTIIVTAQNECGKDSKTFTVKVDQVAPPCYPPVINLLVNESSENNISHKLAGTITNIKNKNDITVKVDGSTYLNFSFNATNGQFSSMFNFNSGLHTITVTAQNECGKDSKTFTVKVDQVAPPCYPPVINLLVNESSENNISHKLAGTITNIKNKNNITVKVDGSTYLNFSFNTANGQFSSMFNFNPGLHTIIVTAQNECGKDSKTFTVKVDQVAPPCYPPVINLLVNESSENNISHKLAGTITNIKNKNGITVKVDGSNYLNFSFNTSNGQFSSNFNFSSGDHTIIVNATNECGSDSKTFTINIKETVCGPRFNPGNDDWQFCLITPSGTYNRSHLTNNSFTYSGNASSLYFKPIAGGSDAIVNGNPYTLSNGQYYLFTGNLKVTVSTSNPGSMGHWSVCLESDNAPTFGNGNNRPISPCENTNNGNSGNNGGNGNSNNSGNNGNNGNGNINGGNNIRNPSNLNKPQ